MAKMDTPDTPDPKDSIADIRFFALEKMNRGKEGEVNTDEFDDVEFAHYRLAVWAHPSSLPRVIEMITRDLIDNTHQQAPSIQRLKELMIDPRYDEPSSAHDDPFEANFTEALSYAHSDEQKFALDAVRRLHVITLSSELTYSGVNPNIRQLVEAILA